MPDKDEDKDNNQEPESQEQEEEEETKSDQYEDRVMDALLGVADSEESEEDDE